MTWQKHFLKLLNHDLRTKEAPKHMIDAFYEGLKTQQNGYSPSFGLPELRDAIAYDESAIACDESAIACDESAAAGVKKATNETTIDHDKNGFYVLCADAGMYTINGHRRLSKW